MLAFLETPRFPSDISYGCVGGPGFNTVIAESGGGWEQRNVLWSQARCRYDAAHSLKDQTQLNILVAFFRVVQGRATGFRFKDWTDYQLVSETTKLITSTTFQLQKTYSTGVGNDYVRIITKPVDGTLSVTADGVLLSNSDWSCDYSKGVLTLNAAPTDPPVVTGEFDVPVRFDADDMKVTIEAYNMHNWEPIPIVELRVKSGLDA